VVERIFVVVAFVSALTVGSCSAGEGDACQIASDCTDGLVCCPAGLEGNDRGTCRPVCAGTPDSGSDAPRDTATDPPSDASDASPSDLPVETPLDAEEDTPPDLAADNPVDVTEDVADATSE